MSKRKPEFSGFKDPNNQNVVILNTQAARAFHQQAVMGSRTREIRPSGDDVNYQNSRCMGKKTLEKILRNIEDFGESVGILPDEGDDADK